MVENIFIAFVLVLITLTTWIAVSLGRAFLLRTAAPVVLINLVFYFIYVKLALYYFLPAVLRMFSNFQFEYEDKVAPIELIAIYAIEFISWGIWLSVFCITIYLASRNKKTETSDYFLRRNFFVAKKAIVVIAFGFLYILAIGVLKLDIIPLFELFKSVLYFCGVAVGPLLLMLSGRLFEKKYMILGIFLCLANVVTISTRGAVVYMLLYFYYLAWFVVENKKAKKLLVAVTLLVAGLYFSLGGLLTGAITVSETGEMKIDIGANAEKSEGRTALQEIEWRFGASTRMGTAFIRLYDKGEGAGILPIMHSALGFLPRSINPDKPIPNTVIPDDIFSQGMYIISREIQGYDTYNMTEFPTGAHFYWEFGLLGVLILSAISALYVSFCVMYFSKFGVIAIPLVIAIFKPWGYMDPKIWVSDLVMQIYQIILPIIFILLLIVLFEKFKNGAFKYLN